MEGQTVIETSTGWMIRCKYCQWHEFPKRRLPNGAAWNFNGDLVRPSFTPSMNYAANLPEMEGYNPEIPSSRCHFILTDGVMNYCGDCSHGGRGTSEPLQPFPAERIAYYAALLKSGGA